jgi:hypothetical protein
MPYDAGRRLLAETTPEGTPIRSYVWFGDEPLAQLDGALEPNPTGYRCRSGKYNDCIMRKAVANTGPLPSYCLIGQNCQTWATRVRVEYVHLALDPQVQKECESCKQ